jgi:excinuclease UvrABC nuclease subunit
MSTINWPGQSGRQYQHWIHPIGASFKEEGGNYIFAKETTPGNWVPIYIGQTNNLRTRLGNHETEAACKRNGATHIHAHTNGGESARLTEELDLIGRWKPPCNTLLK